MKRLTILVLLLITSGCNGGDYTLIEDAKEECAKHGSDVFEVNSLLVDKNEFMCTDGNIYTVVPKQDPKH
jgi:hypothetical protein